jgi:hypothetical protein
MDNSYNVILQEGDTFHRRAVAVVFLFFVVVVGVFVVPESGQHNQ